MQWHEVAVLHAVTEPGQPQGVTSRPTADVSHHDGRRWQVAQHDLLAALGLHHAARLAEAVALVPQRVVGQQGSGVRVVHAPSRCHAMRGWSSEFAPRAPPSMDRAVDHDHEMCVRALKLPGPAH
jgi:hypothetical protein